jgi:hypothetical protein
MEGKSQRGAGSRNLGFIVGEVKVLFWGFGLSVFDLVLWFRAIWIPIGYEPKGSTQKTASTNT